MKLIVRASAIVASALLLASCASPDSPNSASSAVQPVGGDLRDGQTWYLIGSTIDPAPPSDGLALTFEGDTVSGEGPINTWFGPFTAAPDGSLDIGPLASTKMSGTDEEMAAETAYLAALESVDGYAAVDSGELYLFSGDELVLTYSAVPAGEDPTITPETEALAESLVGMSEADAEAAVSAANHELRVGARDGEQFPLTEDFRPKRITITLEKGVVTEAKPG